MVFTFPVFDWSYFFGANLVLKMTIVCLSWNFGTYINSNMQNSMVLFTFSVFDLQVLFKKSTWHVDVTWKLSQQFIRRDLKPVAFLLYWNFVKQRDLQYGRKNWPSFWQSFTVKHKKNLLNGFYITDLQNHTQRTVI